MLLKLYKGDSCLRLFGLYPLNRCKDCKFVRNPEGGTCLDGRRSRAERQELKRPPRQA